MPRPTSTRGVITDAYAPGPSRRKPETRFPSGEKGVCFRGYPRKLDVGTATSRYLVNLPRSCIRYVYMKVCVPSNAPTNLFLSSIIRTRKKFRRTLTQWQEPWAELIGSGGRFCSQEKLELGTGASRMEVRIRYNKGGCGWVGNGIV